MNKHISATVLLVLLLVTAHSLETQARHAGSNTSIYKELPPCDFEAVDSVQAKCPTLLQKFKEARRNNKRNLKRASKFYNPLTLIFRAFDI